MPDLRQGHIFDATPYLLLHEVYIFVYPKDKHNQVDFDNKQNPPRTNLILLHMGYLKY